VNIIYMYKNGRNSVNKLFVVARRHYFSDLESIASECEGELTTSVSELFVEESAQRPAVKMSRGS